MGFGDTALTEFTSSGDSGSPVLPELLDHISEGQEIGEVTSDCACDTRRC